MTDREIIERIESLSVEEQDNLFELIRKRRSPQSGGFANEQRRTEIAEVGERLRQAVKMGTAQSFDNVEDLKLYLQANSEDEIDYIDRDGNPLTYHIKDLYPTEESYDYVTSQGKIFDTCLPDLVSKYAGEYVVFEDGRVIDNDLDEDVLLDRVWQTEFAISRRDRYHGIFCELVPEVLNA
ncbi:hypothetical protein [Chamaesiphon minutus]|uniref:Uncharacterized protein n=1 Tax=Chamaesiphon minutus (strain ATCC 27169 / PCC 6605) TaxID=1173020 RepID=K9UQJ2_CHAP6|nr:hypothetical protein [Chamaesiphon minutus]AFY97070.1 hypothetical protein Cha6605_6243 [Chamaesiphon minutus PCC 6605]